MKRLYIYILILTLGLFVGQASFAQEDNSATKVVSAEQKSSQKDDGFALDYQPQHFSFYDYIDAPITNVLKEANLTIQENEQEPIDETIYTKNLEIISTTVDFYPETNQYIAKGNAKLIVHTEEMIMYANEIVLDQENNEIIGIGNVKIVKAGNEYFGDYIRINTKKESSFFSNPILYYGEIVINAKTATMHTDYIEASEGAAVIQKQINTILSTSRTSGINSNRTFALSKECDVNSQNYKIIAKNIVVKRESDRTSILLKNAKIYRGKHRVGYMPNLLLTTDEEISYLETNFPEIGNRRKIGNFIAPSLVLPMPKASTLKVGPLFAYDSDDDATNEFGLGAFGRLSTPRSHTAVMYASTFKKLVARGKYKFDDNFYLQYVANDYMNSGWLGGEMPKYGAELVHETVTNVPQANMIYKNRLAAGFFDARQKHKKSSTDTLQTMRYKWQGSATNAKPLLAWERYLMLGYAYQHDLTLYQTGERRGVFRAGPRLYSDLGRLSLDLRYYIAGDAGDTPYYFDRYRYGVNNLRFHGQYYVNKYLSLGYITSINIDQVDINGDRFTENQLVASVGTEDLKLRIGYDSYRETTVFGLDMYLGSSKTLVDFDNIKVENPDAKSKKKKKRNKADNNIEL